MFENLATQLSNYQVVLEPDENTPEWWAGAPSVTRASDGAFYLAGRMREGKSPKGFRGYEIRILKSADGRRFEPVARLRREDAGLRGFERPAMVRDPKTDLYKLYGCAPLEQGWGIIKFADVADPAEFDPHAMRMIVAADPNESGPYPVKGFKDPFVLWVKDEWHMFVIGMDRLERIYHFRSRDGETWRREPLAPVMENDGWHNFYTRPASVVPMTFGFLFVYEGSHESWHDPVYNIATGLAYSPDLERFIDLTPDAPLLKSTTPGDYHTWRYSHWLQVKNQIYVYFEAARPNNTNEIRLGVVDLSGPR
ncbi:MAG: hypothetical protein HY706_04110 [Candidatus Hydrogenedentes bacterium]|nr:hypothetical protein [Candidatus Hydrogenedentota bacterium]